MSLPLTRLDKVSEAVVVGDNLVDQGDQLTLLKQVQVCIDGSKRDVFGLVSKTQTLGIDQRFAAGNVSPGGAKVVDELS